VLVVVKEETLPVAATTSEDLGATFATLQKSLCNYLRRHVDDPSIAEDLVQDVFVKALAAINSNQVPSNLTGWLYIVARTTVVDYYRSKRLDISELDENLPDTQQANDELLNQELATCLKPLVLQLPAIYRDTLLATDFDGRTTSSLAKEQGLSQSAIKSRTSRARAMLKEKLLECCHVELSGGIVSDYQRRTSSSCGNGCP
jgi:RNA polymerase sigma-70 factor, ECF subfamily